MVFLKFITFFYMLIVLLECLFLSHKKLSIISPPFVNYILFLLVINIIDRNYEFIVIQPLVTKILFILLSGFTLLILGYKFIKPTFMSFLLFILVILSSLLPKSKR